MPGKSGIPKFEWPKSARASKPDGFYVGFMSEKGMRFKVLALFNHTLWRWDDLGELTFGEGELNFNTVWLTAPATASLR